MYFPSIYRTEDFSVPPRSCHSEQPIRFQQIKNNELKKFVILRHARLAGHVEGPCAFLSLWFFSVSSVVKLLTLVSGGCPS